MLVKVVVYGYANDVVAKVALRTIRELRQVHREGLTGLFVQVVKLTRESGLLEAGPGRHRRHQAQGERKQAQGDELWTHTRRAYKARRSG